MLAARSHHETAGLFFSWMSIFLPAKLFPHAYSKTSFAPTSPLAVYRYIQLNYALV